MRGRIIHYNANDGKGLVAAHERQFAFGIDQWRSDTAPAVNQTVDLQLEGSALRSLSRVREDAVLRERAGALAGRLGSAGGAALESLANGSPGMAANLQGAAARLGKPLLGLHALFAIAALFLPYLEIATPLEPGGRAFTLVGLSDLSARLGSSVGGPFLPGLAILSLALPLFWRSRWAWPALLLPLLATLMPGWALFSAIGKASARASRLDPHMGAAVAGRLLEMLHAGIGLWLCLAAASGLAAIALKRTAFPPADALPDRRHAG